MPVSSVLMHITLASLFVVALHLPAGAQTPLIRAYYSPDEDAACETARGYVIKPEWKLELTERLPEFLAEIDRELPRMLAAASAVTGKPFPSSEYRVRLSLCDVASHSGPVPQINMRFAMSSFTHQPVPLRYKLDTVVHELLHSMVVRFEPAKSALLRQQAAEPMCVRNHLHLLALQKAVLLQLGAEGEYRQLVGIDSLLPGGCYKRAWAIVNERDETYLQFVAELREP